MWGLEKQGSGREGEKAESRSARLETEKLRDSLKEKEAALAEKKRNMISDSSEEARRILQEAKDYADKTISWYAKHGGTSREMEQERDRLRKKMNALSDNIKTVAREEAAAGTLTAGDLKIGDAVRVISMGLKGTVSTLPDAKGNLFVNAGIMRTKVKLRDLERIDEPEITSKNMSRTSSGKVRMSKSFAISPEINLLGKTVDEACAELDKYLDDAALSHLEQVRVVHGKGTGALRAGVHKYLKRNRHVSSFRLGEFGEGDSGVTIVKLR